MAVYDPRGLVPYIQQRAIAYGVDPNIAVRVAASEGLGNPVGDAGKSFGAFQLYTGGGLGNTFQRVTGLDPSNPANEPATIDFALSQAAQGGWGPWHGAARVGIGEFEGIGVSQPTATFDPSNPGADFGSSNSPFAGDPLGGALGGPAFDNPNSPVFGLQNDPLNSGFGGTGNFGVTDFTAGTGINASLGFDPTQQGQAILDANPGIGQTVGQGVANATQGIVTGAAAAPGIAGSLGSLFGTGGGNTDTSSTWFNRLKQDIGDVVARIGIGLLALILIGLAAWAFTAGGGIGAAREATARTIKKSAGFT